MLLIVRANEMFVGLRFVTVVADKNKSTVKILHLPYSIFSEGASIHGGSKARLNNTATLVGMR